MTASCRLKIFVSGEIDGAPGLLRATGANSSLKVNRNWNFRSSFIALCLYARRSQRADNRSRAVGPLLLPPLLLPASRVLRSLQRTSSWALPSLDSSAAETSGLSSSGDFSSLPIHAVPAPGLLSAGLPVRLEEDASRRS